MAEYTEHYNLELPASTEHYDIKVANTNNQIIDEKLYEKVDKIPNKGLSTNDFTNGYKQKLDDLKNYDDTQIKKDISNMKTEITAKDNVQDNKILQLQNEKAELEKELKEAQEDFYQNSIRGQASGEYIHVEDSSNCRARIGIGGNQEQETRSGKNYYFIDDVETTTMSGITYSIKKGLITLNGTATGGIIIKSSTKFSLSGGDYIMSATKIQGSFTGTFGKYVSKNSEIIIDGGLIESTTKKKLASDYTELITHLYIAKGAVCNNYQVKIQLEKGTETSEWEQAGATPSPDYLSKVVTVGSNVNLFDKDTHILVNSSETRVQTDYILLKKGTYTLNFIGADFFYLMIFNENKVKVKETDWTEKNSSFELDNKYYVIIVFRKIYNFALNKDEVVNIKLVEGAEVGEYSQYGQGCVKVTKCNKNLINKNLLTNYQILEDTGKLLFNNTRLITPFICLKKGTYSLSCNLSRFAYAIYNLDKSFNSFVTWKAFPNQIVLNSDCYIKIEFIINPTGSEQVSIKDITYLQLEKENTTDYEEHEEQSYIMPVQQEMLEGDYFDYDNEEEVHIFGKKVLTGNENWEAIGTNASGKYRFQTKVDDIVFNADGDTYLEGICDSYKVGTPNTTYLCQESIATVQYYLIIYNEKVNDTVENFKKGLSNKNVTIYYKLATPTKLAFTDEQKAVAKELNNARTYKNVTNITTDSIAILDLDYTKDLEELTEYSTEERVIGRWIDGKPLYSKVGSIKFTSVYDSSGLHTRGSLIDSDIDYGTVSKVLNKNLLSSSLFNTYGTSTSNVYVENRQGNSNKGYILGFTDRTDLLNTTIYVVVEYTKTTD